MVHIILLGDSIFDNAAYVPNEPCVSEQVQKYLSRGDRVTLLAVDGASIQDLSSQLARIPKEATHLFISLGGNDTLRYAKQLLGEIQPAIQMLNAIAAQKSNFDRNYQQMLKAILSLGKPTTLCTIYDNCPLSDPTLRLLAFTALSVFNDCITRQAFEASVPLIDLRIICNQTSDYSSLSPIEPSAVGGDKIARTIVAIASGCDFSLPHSVIYT
jgi:hypothetical protein